MLAGLRDIGAALISVEKVALAKGHKWSLATRRPGAAHGRLRSRAQMGDSLVADSNKVGTAARRAGEIVEVRGEGAAARPTS